MNVWSKITVSSIIGVGNIPSAKGRFVQMRDRPTWGLSFCRDGGQITYRHKGQNFLSNHSCAVLLPQGQCYELIGDADGVFPLINFGCSLPPKVDSFVLCPLRDSEPYLKDFDRLLRLWLSGEEENHAEIMAIFYSMLARLAAEGGAGVPPALLRPAIEKMHLDMFEPTLSISALAECANLSEVYFRRLFKQCYGTAPKQYILDIRIRKAKQLLSERAASVGTIAEQCGFSSVYHFSRAFKAATGCSPSEYTARQHP